MYIFIFAKKKVKNPLLNFCKNFFLKNKNFCFARETSIVILTSSLKKFFLLVENIHLRVHQHVFVLDDLANDYLRY